jgi:hypothetical protein
MSCIDPAQLPEQLNSGAAELNYSHYVGDTIVMDYGYQDSTGAVINLTGSVVTLEIRRKQSDPEPLFAYSSADGTLQLNVDPTTQIKATINDAHTTQLGEGEHHYFIKCQDSNGIVDTLLFGLISLKLR